MTKHVLLILAVLATVFSTTDAQEVRDDIRLFMPDGQLRNLPVRVYITHDITWDMNPELRTIAMGK